MTPEQLAKTGSEHAEQVALFQWCALTANQLEHQTTPDTWRANALRSLFAINNAVGRNSAIHGARNKAEGVKSGVPDLFMPVPRILQQAPRMAYHHGLFIEMKKRGGKPSDVSKEQREWINRLMAQNYCCAVCFGWEQARDALIEYLR